VPYGYCTVLMNCFSFAFVFAAVPALIT